jgi:hypothetical protein
VLDSTYEECDLALFESGAILFHIAERDAGLLPDNANARARAITWMFAALNTVEPPIVDRGIAILSEHDKTWYGERLPILEDRVHVRLGELASRLGDANWLDDAFSAGELLMVTVLRRLNGSGLLEKYPNLSAYVARGEERPAFRRAFEDQLAVCLWSVRRRLRRGARYSGNRTSLGTIRRAGRGMFAEFQGRAKVTGTGRHYHQNYVVYLCAQDGKIIFAREYFDPARVVAAFS